jgi:hypothetical protein
MKMHHPHYANQKLQTQWGAIQVDASGTADIHKDAEKFFQDTLKFKPLGKGAHVAPPVEDAPPVEASEPVDTEHDQLADAESHELGEDLLAEDGEEEKADDEKAPSRFAKSHAKKKSGHKK